MVNESEELINKILDKINDYGVKSLTKAEKKLLKNISNNIKDEELEDIVSIDSGYEFDGIVDGYQAKFIYDETEEWDDSPVEYVHRGEFLIDGENFYASIYTNKNYKVHSFDLHDGDDYVEFDDQLESELLKFFKNVGEKIKKSM